MRARWLVMLCALASCDYLFRIDYVEPMPTDAAYGEGPPFFDAPEPCPTGYIEAPNVATTSTYRFVVTPLRWQLAELDCEDDAATSITHLAVFETVNELTRLHNFVSGPTLVGYAHDTMAADTKQFFAVTGEALPQTVPPWNMGEPNGTTGTNEEPIVWFSGVDYLIDGPHYLEASFLCECDHRPVTRTFTLP